MKPVFLFSLCNAFIKDFWFNLVAQKCFNKKTSEHS